MLPIEQWLYRKASKDMTRINLWGLISPPHLPASWNGIEGGRCPENSGHHLRGLAPSARAQPREHLRRTGRAVAGRPCMLLNWVWQSQLEIAVSSSGKLFQSHSLSTINVEMLCTCIFYPWSISDHEFNRQGGKDYKILTEFLAT